MIAGLRKKFILINMTLVSLVLVIAFALILLFNYQSLKAETFEALHKATDLKEEFVMENVELGGPSGHKGNPMLPVIVVRLDDAGVVVSTQSLGVTATDKILAEVVETAKTDTDQSGMIFDLQLRYLKEETGDGMVIAFADMSRELNGIRELMITLALVGLAGLAAFYLISRYLSNWALKPVEDAWNKQRQFVADASHELKTPLTVILANLGILKNHKEEAISSQLKWVTNTETEAQRMKTLVDDLLFLAKSDSGDAKKTQVECNLSDLLFETVLPFESLAFEQGITLQFEIEPDIRFVAEAGQVKQLAAILLDNAIKYAGNEGCATVSLVKKMEGIELCVHNTGEPIPQESMEHLFERFYRADESRARKRGGYGLGLSIAQSIVNRHGGMISVKSNEKEGTNFVVTFPISTKRN